MFTYHPRAGSRLDNMQFLRDVTDPDSGVPPMPGLVAYVDGKRHETEYAMVGDRLAEVERTLAFDPPISVEHGIRGAVKATIYLYSPTALTHSAVYTKEDDEFERKIYRYPLSSLPIGILRSRERIRVPGSLEEEVQVILSV